MNKDKLAKIISYCSGLEVWLPTLFLIGLFNTGLTSFQIKILIPILLITQVIFPLGIFHWLIKTKKIKDWDLTYREDRFIFVPIILTFCLIGLGIINILGNTKIFHLFFVSYLVFVIISFITLFWKISLHATLNTLGIIVINYLFGWKLPGLFVIIPLVIWARYQLKKHSLLQLISGCLITIVIVLAGLFSFGSLY